MNEHLDPVNLNEEFRCIRCGRREPWINQFQATVFNSEGFAVMRRPLCPTCFKAIDLFSIPGVGIGKVVV